MAKGKSYNIPPEVLGKIAACNRKHAELVYFVHKNHIKIFKKREAENKDYVAVIPENGGQQPALNFFAEKGVMLDFAHAQPVCVVDYRYSHRMMLMY
ncbi:MAG: hypothetical protein PHQ35_02895 [Phycisphaerae bacterium]|nr:hypothetical protein [Phycisphaerae bacterium]MDD5380760.1 hypothetical protein [Phycisphaerae bacterium]